MEATFSIAVAAETDLVHIVVGGFFDEAAIAQFKAARDDAYRQLLCPPNAHVTLVDMRAMRIQPQEVVGHFGALIAEPRWRSRRIAFVVEPTLARSQIARAAHGRDAAFFTDVAQARAWLLRGDSTLAA